MIYANVYEDPHQMEPLELVFKTDSVKAILTAFQKQYGKLKAVQTEYGLYWMNPGLGVSINLYGPNVKEQHGYRTV